MRILTKIGDSKVAAISYDKYSNQVKSVESVTIFVISKRLIDNELLSVM